MGSALTDPSKLTATDPQSDGRNLVDLTKPSSQRTTDADPLHTTGAVQQTRLPGVFRSRENFERHDHERICHWRAGGGRRGARLFVLGQPAQHDRQGAGRGDQEELRIARDPGRSQGIGGDERGRKCREDES